MIKNTVEYLGDWYDSHDLRFELASWKAVIILDQDIQHQVCIEVICKNELAIIKARLAKKGLEPIKFKLNGSFSNKNTRRIQRIERSGEDVYRFYLSPDKQIERIILL